MKIYGIGGLGADQRVFEKLEFKYPFEFIPWIDPHKNESLDSYCKRLSASIDNTSEFIIIGISFGGIVAQELSKYVNPKLTILISSAYSETSIPILFRVLLKLNFHYLIPNSLITTPNSLIRWFFGVKKEENKQLLDKIISSTSPQILKWSLSKIGTWKGHDLNLEKAIIIHGINDRLLKCPKSFNANEIKNGGHFMIVENSFEINTILETLV